MTEHITTYRARLTAMASLGYRPMVKLTLTQPLRCDCGIDAFVVQRASHVDVTVCRTCWEAAAAMSGKPHAARIRR